MPHRMCPTRETPGRMLRDSSADSVVEYFRCDTPTTPPPFVNRADDDAATPPLHAPCLVVQMHDAL